MKKSKLVCTLLACVMTVGASAQVSDGYYRIKNAGSGKYVEVRGRKTAAPDQDQANVYTKAGTIFEVEAAGNKVTTLRSQGVDPTAYAKKALKYVPGIVSTVVEKLELQDLLGSTGEQTILDKFNESLDVNLYLEEVSGGYRIYGKTPSMKPVVEFYQENKAKVDAKLPGLEQALNDAIAKIVARLKKGESLKNTFSNQVIYNRMVAAGCTDLTAPSAEDGGRAFYQSVLVSEKNVWQFAYQTATYYMEFVEGKSAYSQYIAGTEYEKYWNLIKKIRPDFKYYIVADGDDFDVISEGNTAIKSNDQKAVWTLEQISDDNYFGFTCNENLYREVDGAKKYYTTLYTDFAYQLPEGVKAYYVSSIKDNGNAVCTEVADNIIPAQTPIMLESANTAAEDNKLTPTTGGTAITGNLLKGNDYLINTLQIKTQELVGLFELADGILNGTMLLDDYEHLLLKNAGTIKNKFFFGLTEEEIYDAAEASNATQLMSEGKIHTLWTTTSHRLGYYKYQGDLNGNKAILVIDDANATANSIKSNVVTFGENTTEVDAISAAEGTEAKVYDLQGREVARPFNGVFIINGKKVAFK
ncbi:MAG: RICIN domain-containing protein [Prevotella sp.]|nr:RICIN domain-containing protein [Prevotella sp.]